MLQKLIDLAIFLVLVACLSAAIVWFFFLWPQVQVTPAPPSPVPLAVPAQSF